MRRAVTSAFAVALSLAASGALSRRFARAEHAPSLPPPSHIPQPIGIARVAADVAATSVLVTTDLTLVRGPYAEGDLDVYVAFGSPGPPIAFEAHLCPIAMGFLDASPNASCTKLHPISLPRAPSHAAFAVGRPTMAGALVPLADAELALALGPSKMATLRVRELYAMPRPSAGGTREIVVRLGEARGNAYTLGQVEMNASDGLGLGPVEARLCGPNIDETPLAVIGGSGPLSSGVPPPLAPRATTDDLCIRFQTRGP